MASQNPTENTSGESDENEKRKWYIGWEEYFMAVAKLSAERSKDPSTQVGACIVNKDKRIVGTGYNGMPNRCSDNILPWGKGEGLNKSKYFYVCHAELNAIMNRFSADLKGCTIFVTLFPCNHCAQMIIQSGIHKVVYLSDEKKEMDETKASKKMLDISGVKYRAYRGKMDTIKIQFPRGPTDDGGKMDQIKEQLPPGPTEVRVKIDPIKVQFAVCNTDVRGKMDPIKVQFAVCNTDVRGKMDPIKEQLPPGPTDCQRWNGYLNSNLIKKCFFHLVNEGNMFT